LGAKPLIAMQDSNFFTVSNRRSYDIEVSLLFVIALAAALA
jgi:hypothetical protein